MEYIDIVDEQGNPTGEKVERSIAHSQGIRHSTYLDRAESKWQISGSYAEKGYE